jgi:hypothetical protein
MLFFKSQVNLNGRENVDVKSKNQDEIDVNR